MEDKKPSSDLSPDYLLLRMMQGFGNKLGTIDRMTFSELTGRQHSLIASIGSFEEAPTLGQLAESEESSHQNIKQMALKLQEKGYAKLLSDANDARKIRVTLSKKGSELSKRHHEKTVDFLRILFEDLSAKEIEAASKAIRKLNAGLDTMIVGGLKF